MAVKKEKKPKVEELRTLINLVADSKKPIADKLLKRAEFMEKTLILLEERIECDGAVIKTTNGNGFDVLSEHPAQKSYNTMIGRYNALIKNIADLIPDESKGGDELLDFIGGSK